MTETQKLALAQLYAALAAATECGLLDEITSAVSHPDVINAFCDSVTEMKKREFPEGESIGLQTFEVTGFGFDGATDETDDRVFWVRAVDGAAVELAIAGIPAGFHNRIDVNSDVDFVLPSQSNELRAALLKFVDIGSKTACRLAGTDYLENDGVLPKEVV